MMKLVLESIKTPSCMLVTKLLVTVIKATMELSVLLACQDTSEEISLLVVDVPLKILLG